MLTGLGWSVVSVPMGNGLAIVNAACQAASDDRKNEEVLFLKNIFSRTFFCKKKDFELCQIGLSTSKCSAWRGPSVCAWGLMCAASDSARIWDLAKIVKVVWAYPVCLGLLGKFRP